MAYKGSQTQRSRIVGLSQAGNEAASDARLDNFIDRNQNLKDQSASVNSILQDMPKKNADFVRRQLEKTGGKRLNEAAKSMLSFYTDERPEYSRQMNRLRTSSPAMEAAYARKFPLTNFAMNAPANFVKNTLGGKIISSIGGRIKDTVSTGVGTLKDKIANVINPKFVDPYPNASSSYDYDSLNIEGYPDEIQRRLQVGPISEDDTSETNIKAIKLLIKILNYKMLKILLLFIIH